MSNLNVTIPLTQPVIFTLDQASTLAAMERYETLIRENEDLHRQLTTKQEALDKANTECEALRTALAELQASAG
jgi:chromosome segregation ATPase